MLRLKELRKKNGLSQQQLAKELGVTQATLSGWENEKYEIDNSSLLKCSDIFKVSVDYLLGYGDDFNKKKGVYAPVLGNVKAGIPLDAIEEIIDYEEITPEMASQGEYFGLRVRGDSMEPRIKEGDVVIVRKQSDVDSGDTAIVLVNGNEATVKRVKKTSEGIMLIPNNPQYDVMFFTNQDIEELPLTILGKVVELRGKF